MQKLFRAMQEQSENRKAARSSSSHPPGPQHSLFIRNHSETDLGMCIQGGGGGGELGMLIRNNDNRQKSSKCMLTFAFISSQQHWNNKGWSLLLND